MDVLSQALSVVKQAESVGGPVTLTFDLEDPAHKAAYAAALAVLQINGIDLGELEGEHATPASREQESGTASKRASKRAKAKETSAPVHEPSTDMGGEADAPIRRSYASALAELTTDEDRQRTVLRDTFPRVRELLRDGANVEAVAQIQYRRWTEENLDSVRG